MGWLEDGVNDGGGGRVTGVGKQFDDDAWGGGGGSTL